MGKREINYVPIIRSQERKRLASSKISQGTLFFLRLIGPLYLRFILNVNQVRIMGLERLAGAWRDFQEKRSRLIIAFRHPYGDDPQIFAWAFDVLLPRLARRAGKPLPRRPHARFVHGYEVALWGDALTRWVMPRIGAVPIYHVKLDSSSIKTIRTILSEDECPLALAPEGQVSYRSQTVPRLERGTAQMAFWCAHDVKRPGTHGRVMVLPLSIHYRYDPRDGKKLGSFLRRLERSCGLPDKDRTTHPLYGRLLMLEERILSMAEGHYSKAYAWNPQANSAEPKSLDRRFRWNALMVFALETAERALGIPVGKSQDDLLARVYQIRQECWDRIYPETSPKKGSELEAVLAHRRTGEAWYAMRHMELVDIAFYLNDDYLDCIHGQEPSFDRLVESALNLEDLISRLSGGNISHRSTVFRKTAVIVAAEALDAGARLDAYGNDRKAAVDKLTDDLEKSFLECIQDYLDGGNHG